MTQSEILGMITASEPSGPLADMPIAPEFITAGNPVARGAVFNQSADKTLSSGLWTCEPGEFDWSYTWDEFVYVFEGEVRRGVQWVYPSADQHDPARHFTVGRALMWYEFKSTSKQVEVMTRPHFCGVLPGPRTIFTVNAVCGYAIEAFSFFQGVDSEHEVLFRPLSTFKVLHATKNIIDPKETVSLERSGFPAAISLQQVSSGGAGGAQKPGDEGSEKQ